MTTGSGASKPIVQIQARGLQMVMAIFLCAAQPSTIQLECLSEHRGGRAARTAPADPSRNLGARRGSR
jgi:hypothetical protein